MLLKVQSSLWPPSLSISLHFVLTTWPFTIQAFQANSFTCCLLLVFVLPVPNCLVFSSPIHLRRVPFFPSFRSVLNVKPYQRSFCDYATLVPILVPLCLRALLHFSYYSSQQIIYVLLGLLQLEYREELCFVSCCIYLVLKIEHSRYSENIYRINE